MGWIVVPKRQKKGQALLIPEDRPADGRHDRVYLRHCPDPHGRGPRHGAANTVRFNADLSQSVGSGRSDAQVELIELV
jgi:hypothetical protein